MKQLWGNLKQVWKYSKNQKSKIICYLFLDFLSIGINIFIPILSAKIIIYLTGNDFYQLILASIMIFLIENVRNLVHYFSRYFSQVIYRESFSAIQLELGKQILRLENKTFDANSSGVFIQRLTNDTSKLAEIFDIINGNLSNIVINIGIFAAIYIINKIVFVYILVMTIILFITENTRAKKRSENDKIYRKKNEKVSGFVGEIVRGNRDIKMLNSEKSFITELKTKIIDLNETRYRMQNVNRTFRLAGGFIRDLTDLLLIIILVFLMKEKVLAVASALIIYNYTGRVPSIIYDIGMLIDGIKDFNLSSDRVFAIINGKEYPKETFGKKHFNKIKGDFEFRNVSFAYDKPKVLTNINFKIKSKETVAFVGKSGSGKSTIFNLLCKMYDVNEGEILIDGVNINELDKDSIRGNITIISQNPYIFNLSIKDNLRLVKQDLTEKEMIKACKLACLHDYIKKLPDKYDTIIGEGGINLSGGQKQRLAIARALIQKTEIILFDEATSALDNETQADIQKAIDNMKKEYTILIIAHRLSTIVNCDRILFLNNGAIECEGSHKQMLRNSENYRHLYETEIKNNSKKIIEVNNVNSINNNL